MSMEEVYMYKISQLSKISELTVKALRYYDEENILKPNIEMKKINIDTIMIMIKKKHYLLKNCGLWIFP